jgi:hypothetical protein
MEMIRDYSKIPFCDDSVLIYQPRYTDETRLRVRAIVALPNGQLMQMEKSVHDRESKVVRDIFLQYTPDEIMEYTRRENVVLPEKTRVDEKAAQRKARDEEMALTFQAKVKALEIPEVQNFADKRVTRRLRKAKSPFEVAALVALILQKHFENSADEQKCYDTENI